MTQPIKWPVAFRNENKLRIEVLANDMSDNIQCKGNQPMRNKITKYLRRP